MCVFCKERIAWVDYKDTNLLRRLMSDRGKIKARRVTGTCRQHQRDAATAIKTARELALLPYVVRTATDKGPGRGGRGGGRGRDQAPRVETSAEAEGKTNPWPTPNRAIRMRRVVRLCSSGMNAIATATATKPIVAVAADPNRSARIPAG